MGSRMHVSGSRVAGDDPREGEPGWATAETAAEPAGDAVIDEQSAGEPAAYFRRAWQWQRWLALALLIPALPVLMLAGLAVCMTSRGPIFYRQTRVGREGRHFELIKIRTMRVDAEAETGAVWTTSLHDPRITFVGKILRLTHIDELPQLWNVLRGEMALVGPRPERPEFTGMLVESIPGYLDRLMVLPGVTGLAQLNLPADSGLDSVRRKLELDLRYVQEGSFFLDLRIIVCTIARVVGIRNAGFRRLLAVAREVDEVESSASDSSESVRASRLSAQSSVSPRELGRIQQRQEAGPRNASSNTSGCYVQLAEGLGSDTPVA